jgi:hypothetical protein
MEEELEIEHTRGRRVLRGWWWPVGTKLVSDQMATPVPEMRNGSLQLSWGVVSYYTRRLANSTVHATFESFWDCAILGYIKMQSRVKLPTFRRSLQKLVNTCQTTFMRESQNINFHHIGNVESITSASRNTVCLTRDEAGKNPPTWRKTRKLVSILCLRYVERVTANCLWHWALLWPESDTEASFYVFDISRLTTK